MPAPNRVFTLRPCPAGGRLWAEHQLGGGAACDAGGHSGLHVTRGAALPREEPARREQGGVEVWEEERQGRQGRKAKGVGHPGNTSHAPRPGAACQSGSPRPSIPPPFHLRLPQEKVELGYTDAVDVWAAGILAYELLVRRHNWRGRVRPAGRSLTSVQMLAEPVRCVVGCILRILSPHFHRCRWDGRRLSGRRGRRHTHALPSAGRHCLAG